MRALVVYESMFGNTEVIAHAIADGLRPHAEVEVRSVADAASGPPPEVDLLVVGGPTHAFGLSRASTRQDAAHRRESPVEIEIGIREWLDAALPTTTPRLAAAFGTKVAAPPWLPGSSARGIGKRLRRIGYRLVVPPMDFHVDGMTGPLADGERERARAWAAGLAAGASSIR